MNSLGKFCQSYGITEEQIKSKTLKVTEPLCNGLVLELKSYSDGLNWTIQQFVELLSSADVSFASVKNPTAVIGKLNTVKEQKRKLSSKKKVKGVKNVQELLERKFSASVQRNDNETSCNSQKPNETHEPTPACQHQLQAQEIPSQKTCMVRGVQTDLDCDEKDLNVLKYKIQTHEHRLLILSNKVSHKKEELESINYSVGHYSVKNVNKRDKTARKNLHLLRDAQRTILKQNKNIQLLEIEKLSCEELRNSNENLKEHIETLTDRTEIEINKKVALQKANSYLRSELSRHRTQGKVCDCTEV